MPKTSSYTVRVFSPRYSRDEVIERLRERVVDLDRLLPLTRVVLFGSYATGRHTAASDIDLLIVYRGERREDAFKLVKETFGLYGLEPHLYTEEEAEGMAELIRRMTEDGVEIWNQQSA